MTVTLSQYVIDGVYHDVQGIIRMYVRRWIDRYGTVLGGWEEVESMANEFFMDAYSTFDASRSEFNTWVGNLIRFNLLTAMKKKFLHDKRFPAEEATFDELAPKQSSFVLPEFLEELSEDARTVAELVLDAPIDIRLALAQHKTVKPSQLRRAVMGFLKDIGWCAERIAESFSEVSEALRS